MDNYLVIGEIVKPQGVRGEVKLRTPWGLTISPMTR